MRCCWCNWYNWSSSGTAAVAIKFSLVVGDGPIVTKFENEIATVGGVGRGPLKKLENK